jgi:hypothetical protein
MRSDELTKSGITDAARDGSSSYGTCRARAGVMQGVHRLCLVALVLVFVACTTSKDAAQEVSVTSDAEASQPRPVCPVTLPDGDHRRGDPAGLGEFGYGTGELWVGLWPHGHVRATRDNVNRQGAIFMKFPWDRAVKGRLHITGRRIDAEAPPLRALLSDYGLTGFQPSTLVFPTEGCWEVTGRVGGRASLTFVTRVTVSA